MYIFYRAINFIKKIPEKIKWFFQRGIRGYSDCDNWSIDMWFSHIVPQMLKKLKNESYGYPCAMTKEEWDEILDKMIFCFNEMNEYSCTQNNEYEEEYINTLWGENKNIKDLFVPTDNNEENYKLTLNEALMEIKQKYMTRETELSKYRENMKNEGFRLFTEYFWDLWY